MTARIGVLRGDITAWRGDAIVTTACQVLTSREGLNGRIIERGGPDMLERLGERAETEPGDVYLTPGFGLPARHVLHAVSSVPPGGSEDESEVLERCLRRCFAILRVIGATRVGVAAPGIGGGGSPVEAAASLAVRVAREELARSPDIVAVEFVVCDDAPEAAYRARLSPGPVP